MLRDAISNYSGKSRDDKDVEDMLEMSDSEFL